MLSLFLLVKSRVALLAVMNLLRKCYGTYPAFSFLLYCLKAEIYISAELKLGSHGGAVDHPSGVRLGCIRLTDADGAIVLQNVVIFNRLSVYLGSGHIGVFIKTAREGIIHQRRSLAEVVRLLILLSSDYDFFIFGDIGIVNIMLLREGEPV